MSSNIDQVKQAILEAIKKEDFTAFDIISEYQIGEVAEALTAVIYDRRVSKDDDRVKLSEAELQNIYLLARTIITKDMINKKERNPNSSLSKKTPANTSAKALIPDKVLAFMYRLQPAY